MAETIRFTNMSGFAREEAGVLADRDDSLANEASQEPEAPERIHQRLIDNCRVTALPKTSSKGPGRYSGINRLKADAADARHALTQFELERLNSGRIQE